MLRTACTSRALLDARLPLHLGLDPCRCQTSSHGTRAARAHAVRINFLTRPGTLIARHQPTTLHRLLAAHACITYDISTSPVFLRLPFPRLLEAATWPACANMHITCEGLPWPIDIEIPTSDGTALTCLTVLCGIFSSLQRPVSGLEWQVTSPTMQAVAWDAFVRRCHANPSRTGQRLKRLDFLSGRTSFKGLSLSPDGWIMHVVRR